ncbi:MAG TPA: sigma-70 family RNA polymerase sigma factor [Polyangiaceae bacterium]|nr:sigma-70 family RNA polymerase sigma factor [Polyangiaceae bacterium]
MTRETDPKSLLDHARATEVLAHVLATVHAVVRRVLGRDDPEHEDVVQTTLEQLLTFSSQKAARDDDFARQWASVVARNVAVDALRARLRERRVLSRADDAAATARPSYLDPERIASARESLAQFSEGLVRLREISARIVFMHDVLGHSLAEISVELDMSVAAAQSRLVRGRRQITTDEVKKKSGVRRRAPSPDDPPAHSSSRRVAERDATAGAGLADRSSEESPEQPADLEKEREGTLRRGR